MQEQEQEQQQSKAHGVVNVSAIWKFKFDRSAPGRADARTVIKQVVQEAVTEFVQATGIECGYRYNVIVNQSAVVTVKAQFEVPDLDSHGVNGYFTRALKVVTREPVTVTGEKLLGVKFNRMHGYEIHRRIRPHSHEAKVIWDEQVRAGGS